MVQYKVYMVLFYYLHFYSNFQSICNFKFLFVCCTAGLSWKSLTYIFSVKILDELGRDKMLKLFKATEDIEDMGGLMIQVHMFLNFKIFSTKMFMLPDKIAFKILHFF